MKVLLVDSTVSTAKKRHRTHNCIKIPPPVFHRHFLVTEDISISKEGFFGSSLQVVGEVQSRPSSLPDSEDASKHLCPPDPFFTCNLIPVCVHKCDGGWASLLDTTVFSPFSKRPTSANSCIKVSKRKSVSCAVRAKSNMSSANLKSRSFGTPSCRSMPHCACSTSSLHFRIAHCCTDEKSFGLRTHPCLTPEFVGKHFFFFSRLFSRDKVSESCFTGQLPDIGTVFILANSRNNPVRPRCPAMLTMKWTNQWW